MSTSRLLEDVLAVPWLGRRDDCVLDGRGASGAGVDAAVACVPCCVADPEGGRASGNAESGLMGASAD